MWEEGEWFQRTIALPVRTPRYVRSERRVGSPLGIFWKLLRNIHFKQILWDEHCKEGREGAGGTQDRRPNFIQRVREGFLEEVKAGGWGGIRQVEMGWRVRGTVISAIILTSKIIPYPVVFPWLKFHHPVVSTYPVSSPDFLLFKKKKIFFLLSLKLVLYGQWPTGWRVFLFLSFWVLISQYPKLLPMALVPCPCV